MPSLWTSLLFLHGYVADHQLALRLAERIEEPASSEEGKSAEPATYNTAMDRLVARGRALSLRLCQGIGSGLVHMQ
ncbi:hypothetical protein SAMN05216570_1098 [Dyella sp. OK004]|uniref:hypothetical protein n=1 Tax=Dyella sp. OK004 TaxID=1855292 RepID=UPI0008E84938|nr:hypothetical protein [Dyella sp. OK004]SFR94990.1 hypothetical protein SAMN05216570_1098 [Dyella sp. OK004]